MSTMMNEELSKKSFEVVVHLDAKALPHTSSDSESDLSDTQDESGRPICNTWNGRNHDLHVVGRFDSDFARRLKTYQVPSSIPLSMDTFCRVEANYPAGEPLIDDAFLLWENPQFEELLLKKMTKEGSEDSSEKDAFDSDSSSETEQEIGDYVKFQKKKKLAGESVTGEFLIFDEDHDIIRNLHSDSISLTTYGGIPTDDKIFGKAELLFDQLSPEEKALIQAATNCSTSKLSPREDKVIKQAEKGSGDSVIS